LLKPAIQLQLKTLWNAIQPLAGFIYQEVELRRHQGQPQAIDIRLRPHQGRRQTSVTQTMTGFLARWARRLSWKETAQVFQTSQLGPAARETL